MTGTTLVRRFYDAVTHQRDEELDTLLAKGFRAHNGRPDDGARGPAAVLGAIGVLRNGFDNLRFDVEDAVEQGDRVAARWTMHGTHTGEVFGKPATGRTVEQTGMVFYRTADDQLAELWVLVDAYGLINQLS